MAVTDACNYITAIIAAAAAVVYLKATSDDHCSATDLPCAAAAAAGCAAATSTKATLQKTHTYNAPFRLAVLLPVTNAPLSEFSHLLLQSTPHTNHLIAAELWHL